MRPTRSDETYEVAVTMSPLSTRRTVSGPAAAWWIAAIAVAVVATVVRPQWPGSLVDALVRVGGIWRSLVLPLPLVACAWVVFVNTASAGHAWAWVHSLPSRWWREVTVALVLATSILAVVLNVGTVTATQISRPIILWVIQLVLHPDTPLAFVLATSAGATLIIDKRRVSFLDILRDRLSRRSRSLEHSVCARAPFILSMISAATVAGVFYPDAMQGWFKEDPPDSQKYNFYSSFFNYSISDSKITIFSGYELGERGLMLKSGRAGDVTFSLDRPPQSIVLLKANFYNKRFLAKGEIEGVIPEISFPNSLEISTDRGSTFVQVFADRSLGEVVGNETIDLSSFLGEASSYLLKFRAENPGGDPVLVLPLLVISVVVDPSTAPHPDFPIVPTAAVLSASIYFGLRCWFSRPVSASWATILISSTITIIYIINTKILNNTILTAAISHLKLDRTLDAQLSEYLILLSTVLISIFVLTFRIYYKKNRLENKHAIILLCGVIIFVISLVFRWEELIRVRYEFLLPDAQGYLAIAREFSPKELNFSTLSRTAFLRDLGASGYDRRASAAAVFYLGGHNGREPLWPAVIHWFGYLFGLSAFHARLVSVICSCTVAFLTALIGSLRINILVGIISGLLIAINPPLIANAVKGLREELVTCFILVLVLVMSSGRVWRPLASDFREWFRVPIGDRWPVAGRTLEWWRIVLAGVAGAGVILVRADMVVLVAMVGGTFTAMFRWGWRTWVPIAALALGFAAPMYVGYWATQGDPFWPGTYGASVNRNLEFPERMGTPGFPSAAEYAANWAAGPVISPITYFFGYHTPMQFLEYSVTGFERIFREILFADQPALLVLFWVGLGLSVVSGRWIIPWGIAMTLLPFYAFMAGVPNPWVFPGRYAHQALPFATLAVAWAVCGVPIMGISWFNRRKDRIVRSGSGG